MTDRSFVCAVPPIFTSNHVASICSFASDIREETLLVVLEPAGKLMIACKVISQEVVSWSVQSPMTDELAQAEIRKLGAIGLPIVYAHMDVGWTSPSDNPPRRKPVLTVVH